MEKILEVTEIKLAVLKSFPPQLSIDASGRVSTGGWSNPQLKPHVYVRPPEDGIYDFDFVADRPGGIVPQIVSPIHAGHVMKTFPETLKGVRIHASQNSKTALLHAGGPDRQPNRFILSGDDVTQIEYYPRALGPLEEEEEREEAADARFEYEGPEGHFVFRGEEIGQEQNILGLLVSVTLQPNGDAGGLDFALVLPPIHLHGEAHQAFETIGIRIHSRGRVTNPAGAELAYEVTSLEGVAEDIPIL